MHQKVFKPFLHNILFTSEKKQKYNINEANLHFFTIVVAVFVLVNTLLKTFLTIPGKCKQVF